MKTLNFLKSLKDNNIEIGESPYCFVFYNEAIKELEDLQNKSCDGCIHKSEGVMEYSCFECSRYYSDRFDAEV